MLAKNVNSEKNHMVVGHVFIVSNEEMIYVIRVKEHTSERIASLVNSHQCNNSGEARNVKPADTCFLLCREKIIIQYNLHTRDVLREEMRVTPPIKIFVVGTVGKISIKQKNLFEQTTGENKKKEIYYKCPWDMQTLFLTPNLEVGEVSLHFPLYSNVYRYGRWDPIYIFLSLV